MTAAFKAADAAETGSLSRAEVKQVLKAPKLGLTKKQVQMLVVHVDGRGGASLGVAQVLSLLDILEEVKLADMQRQDLGAIGDELKEALGKLGAQAGHFNLVAPAKIKDLLLDKFPLLSTLQISAIMSEAPYDAAGLVRWADFLPALSMMVAAMSDPSAVAERNAVAARANFEPVELMDGKDRELLTQMLQNLFTEADKDGNGWLDYNEFEECLASTSLNFTKGDIQMLMGVADADDTGRITYAQFTQLAYDVLLHVARERAISAAMEAEKAATATE